MTQGDNFSRADFLRVMLAAGAAAAVGVPAHAAAAMNRRGIPATGEMLPVVGLGTARAFDVGAAARAPQTEILRLLFESGGSVVDTSPMYGRAERVIGDSLRDLDARKRAFIATKVWTNGRQRGVDQMRESLKLLRSGRIDLMQVHNLVDWRTQLATVRDWRERSTFRYIGITHWTQGAVEELIRIVAAEKIDFVQLPYSIGMRAAEDRLLPLCADRGVATLVNRPFVRGGLFRQARGRPVPPWARAELGVQSWAQYFLKYILGHAAVTCVIPGTGKPRHMRDNLAAGAGRLPDSRQQRKMLTDWQRG